MPVSIPLSRSSSRTASTISWVIFAPYPSSIRFARTSVVVGDLERLAARSLDGHGPLARRDDLAAKAPVGGVLSLHLAADGTLEMRARAQRPVEARRGDLDRVLVEVGPEDVRDPRAERVVDPLRVVDVDAEALLAGQLERQHLDARKSRLDLLRDLSVQLFLLVVNAGGHLDRLWKQRSKNPLKTNGRAAPIS